MEKTHNEVEKKIQETEKRRTSNAEETKKSQERLSKAQSRLSELKANIIALREQRQTALAEGDDAVASNLSKKLKDIEAEQELKTDERAGLETHIAKLTREGETLTHESKRLSIRVLQLHTVALAAEYNKLAEQLADVVKELNKTNWQIQRESGINKPLVVFALKEGALERIPKILFDEDGPYLEEFVARHPGRYPSGLQTVDRCFYDWDTHFQDVIHGRDSWSGIK